MDVQMGTGTGQLSEVKWNECGRIHNSDTTIILKVVEQKVE